MLVHGDGVIRPDAGHYDIFVAHHAVVRVGPAAERVLARHVAVAVLLFHFIAVYILVVNRVRLTRDVIVTIGGQGDTLRLIRPAVCHLVRIHQSIGGILQLRFPRLAVGQAGGGVGIVVPGGAPGCAGGVRHNGDSQAKLCAAKLGLGVFIVPDIVVRIVKARHGDGLPSHSRGQTGRHCAAPLAVA